MIPESVITARMMKELPVQISATAHLDIWRAHRIEIQVLMMARTMVDIRRT
jgi:hypothetical protein